MADQLVDDFSVPVQIFVSCKYHPSAHPHIRHTHTHTHTHMYFAHVNADSSRTRM